MSPKLIEMSKDITDMSYAFVKIPNEFAGNFNEISRRSNRGSLMLLQYVTSRNSKDFIRHFNQMSNECIETCSEFV